MMIKNIVLDVGDVLLEYRWKDMLMDYGLDESTAIVVGREMFDDPLWRQFDLDLLPCEDIIKQYEKNYPEHKEAIRWFITHGEYMHVPRPDVWEKVHTLKTKGFGIYILSNYSEEFFEKHTKGASFIEDADGMVVSYQIHKAKPDREIYQYLFDKYNLDPSECIFFDDRAENVEASNKIGMKSIQITSKDQLLEELTKLEPKRRVRYKGTHPRNFNEKYKELNPEKYGDIIEKVISKGSTPAGMHISICVKEIIDFLQIKPGQRGVDATLGYGGHTRKMLECLKGEGHIYGLDVDPIESVKTTERLRKLGYGEDILSVRLLNFADIDKLAQETGKFDFVLADLGVSSMQIDNPERGFSYKTDGPLDLRLNPQKGISAAQRLENISLYELEGMLIENSDEPYASEIAEAVIKEIKKGKKIDTTTKLYNIIKETLSFLPANEQKDAVKKSCQRTFQALRIDVNSEFEVLDAFLEKLPDVLNPGGRVAILTFHSGEDRLVKKSFKRHMKAGDYTEVSKDVIRPSKEECMMNGRAKSTKMRWAIK